jgi:hypothetical protein
LYGANGSSLRTLEELGWRDFGGYLPHCGQTLRELSHPHHQRR